MGDAASARLLQGEKVLISSDDDMLVLTNMRVRYDERVRGSTRYVSIMLQSISSCALVTRSWPALLGLAVAAGLVGLLASDDMRLVAWVAAAILVIAYYRTRSGVLRIASSGGDEIVVPVAGMGRSAVLDFLDQVDAQRIRT